MEFLSNDYNVVWLGEVDSTNNYLKEWFRREPLEEGTTVVANYQVRGRGQRGNGWSSEKGKNLLFSLLLYPKGIKANEQFILSCIASLAVKRVLDRFIGDVCIKWPNDIYWKEEKIAGMLIENELLGGVITHSVVGIGINVNQRKFPTELPNPVSLWQITGMKHDRTQLLEAFLREFFAIYGRLREGLQEKLYNTIATAYMASLYRADGYHWYEDHNGRFQAAIQEVMPSGHLVLKTLDEGETRRYAFKEVAYVNP
ncbi:MAG: biotin--[acetyl-CoA-carboxylase] ligase [Fermentimonas sp.]|jgi:BirA family biotin operon repressor/biotin-[acetyl-CoA-carboxylase] ligase